MCFHIKAHLPAPKPAEAKAVEAFVEAVPEAKAVPSGHRMALAPDAVLATQTPGLRRFEEWAARVITWSPSMAEAHRTILLAVLGPWQEYYGGRDVLEDLVNREVARVHDQAAKSGEKVSRHEIYALVVGITIGARAAQLRAGAEALYGIAGLTLDATQVAKYGPFPDYDETVFDDWAGKAESEGPIERTTY